MLRVRVLGLLEVEGVPSERLGSRKGRTLLKRLILARGRPVAVDALVDCLWPEGQPAHPAEGVAVLVSRLRAVLGPGRIRRSDAGYALRVDWLDVDAVAGLAVDAERRLVSGSIALARAAAVAGLEEVRGTLLADEPDAEWLVAERAGAERLVATLRHAGAHAALIGGDTGDAVHLATAALDADPYDELALRLLMQAHAAAGQPAAALAAFDGLRRRLDDDLGIDPAPETAALHQAILRGEPGGPGYRGGPGASGPARPGPAGRLPGDRGPSGPPAGAPLPAQAAALAAPGAPMSVQAAALAASDGAPLSTRAAALAAPGSAPLPARAAAPAASDGAALPGRGAALATLDAALERAAGGETIILCVEGEAGIGKSRLLEVWAGRAAASATVLRARGDELERRLPLQPVLDALDAHLRSRASPAAVLAVLGPEHALLAPLLPAAPPAPPAGADPAGGLAVLFSALLAVVGRLADARPVVLVLDDLHLADGATLEWLHFLERRGGGLRVLVLGAVRSEEPVRLPPAQRLILGPLDLEAVAAVVGRQRAAVLAARSGGHPLFLVELAAAGTGDGAPGDAPAGAPSEGGALPVSLREAIGARCARAGAPVADTLRVAALLGSTVDPELLAGILALPPLAVLAHLEEGVRRGLLAEADATLGANGTPGAYAAAGRDGASGRDGADPRREGAPGAGAVPGGEGAAGRQGGHVFRHQLVREALAAESGAARRALVHREAARLLAARPHAAPLAIAHHARLGGERELSASALARAADLAAERYDYAAGVGFLTEAIALVEPGESGEPVGDRSGADPALRLQRSRARLLLGDHQGAAADARAALDAGGGAAALEASGWAAYYARDFAAARRYAEDGAALADGPARALCLTLAGRVLHATGDLPGSQIALQAALRLAERPPAAHPAPAHPAPVDPARRQEIAAWLGQVRWHQGRAADALELAGPAARTLRGPASQGAALHARMTVAGALGTLGRAAEALAAAGDYAREVERQGATRYRGRAENFRSWVLRALGAHGEADDWSQRALELARGAGGAEAQVHALLDLADGRLQAHDPAGAAAFLDAAEPLQAGNHAYRWRHLWRDRLLRGRLALQRGQPEGALELAAGLRRAARAAGVRRYADLAAALELEARAGLGEPIDGSSAATLLEALPQAAGLEAWRLAGAVAAAAGEDRLWATAERHAARLAATAGDLAGPFERYARARLERMRTAGRHG